MNYRYSVIIPVYNGEKTLCRCLDSLLACRREDAQIILISDGSSDSTDAIAGSYGSRICFIRQDHGSVSAARNRGVQEARGRYITFVDCDDFVSADYFARLDREPDCDILVFGLEKRLIRAMEREDPVGVLLRNRKLLSVCFRRFRGDWIRESGIRFPENLQTGEDFCFCFRASLAAKTLRGTDARIYHVDTANRDSLSRRYRPQLAAELNNLYRLLAESGRYLPELDYLWARSVLTCLAECWKAGKPTGARIREICETFAAAIGPVRGLRHRLLRFFLARRWYRLLAWIAYWGKGRTYGK